MHFRNTLFLSAIFAALPLVAQVAATTPLQRFNRHCGPAGLDHLGFQPNWRSDERQRTIEELSEWVRTQNIRSPRDLVASFQRAGNNEWPTRTFAITSSRSAQ